MNRISFVVIIIVILLGQMSEAEKLSERCPDWLTGVVSIDLFGSDSLEDSWPLDRYVCAFDFNLGRVDTIEIPYGAFYTKDWQEGGHPIVIYPSEHGYYYSDGYSSWRWREVNFLEIVRIENENEAHYAYGELLKNLCIGDKSERKDNDNSIYYGTIHSESPMKILGINAGFDTEENRSGMSVFYLQYGTSKDGELEIMLIREDNFDRLDAEKNILYHFPLKYDFGAMQFSISNTGRICWIEDKNIIVCADEYGTVRGVSTGKLFGRPVWYDNTSILFFEAKDEYSIMPRESILKIWDVENGTIVDFFDAHGKQINGSIFPFTMALNEDRSILAIYGWESTGTRIKFINLDNGEIFVFDPWPNFHEGHDSENQNYGIAEDGILFFDPASKFQSQVVWFPE